MTENTATAPSETPAEGGAIPAAETPASDGPPSEPVAEAQPASAPAETPKAAPEPLKAAPDVPKPVPETPNAFPEATKQTSAQKVAVDRSYRASRPSKELSSRGTKSKSTLVKSKSAMLSALNIKRGSYATYQAQTKVPRYMNSYKLDAEKPFNPDKVQSIILKVFGEILPDNMAYDPEICASKAKTLSQMIRLKVKEQDYDRYKLVCLVTIGEKKSHDVFTGVRFLWDSERDRFATHMHETMHIYCVASVFALYYE